MPSHNGSKSFLCCLVGVLFVFTDYVDFITLLSVGILSSYTNYIIHTSLVFKERGHIVGVREMRGVRGRRDAKY